MRRLIYFARLGPFSRASRVPADPGALVRFSPVPA